MTIFYVGLAVGAVYALVGIGYNITLAQSGVFNFAQGALMILGTYLAWFTITSQGWPWWTGALFGAAVCGAVGLLIELIAIRPTIRRLGGHAELVTTVGASVVIDGILLATWARTPKSVEFFGGERAFTLLGGRLNPVDVWIFCVAVVVAVSLHLVSRRTTWGLGGQASNDDPESAKVKGVNVTALRVSAFMLAGALAGLLGPITAPKIGVDVAFGITLTVFGFVAGALGGFGNYLGCLVAGLGVGLMQAYAARYLGAEYPPLILFATLLAVLLLKPAGLFGRTVRTV